MSFNVQLESIQYEDAMQRLRSANHLASTLAALFSSHKGGSVEMSPRSLGLAPREIELLLDDATALLDTTTIEASA